MGRDSQVTIDYCHLNDLCIKSFFKVASQAGALSTQNGAHTIVHALTVQVSPTIENLLNR